MAKLWYYILSQEIKKSEKKVYDENVKLYNVEAYKKFDYDDSEVMDKVKLFENDV